MTAGTGTSGVLTDWDNLDVTIGVTGDTVMGEEPCCEGFSVHITR